ncbi:Hypothetical protein CAP_6989 [Chondromyces apiculatus DSM 436]|uniref:Uncharacterized protein n=1 Tax=Chondromyces apiculatus DSM 436 TaxID=1192034 RepID=A0A017TGC8_9BACT|nr:Hypothetical protein CAP_6989 [Chondromyces apiculatus DSM 436]
MTEVTRVSRGHTARTFSDDEAMERWNEQGTGGGERLRFGAIEEESDREPRFAGDNFSDA